MNLSLLAVMFVFLFLLNIVRVIYYSRTVTAAALIIHTCIRIGHKIVVWPKDFLLMCTELYKRGKGA